MIVKCSAATCRFYCAGICRAKELQLIDFEYYKDEAEKEKSRLSDDMKCITYKSIYEVED